MRLLAISVFVLLPLAVSAQDKGDKGKGGGRGPQNLKVLKVSSMQEIRPIMAGFTTGLGVQCAFCHAGRDFASDENPKKEIARHMIQMVDQINAGFNAATGATDAAAAKQYVTCYTCHRGEQEPKTAPDAAKAGGQ